MLPVRAAHAYAGTLIIYTAQSLPLYLLCLYTNMHYFSVHYGRLIMDIS